MYFDCLLHNAIEAGDDTLFIGLVQAGGARNGEPLLYFDGPDRAPAPFPVDRVKRLWLRPVKIAHYDESEVLNRARPARSDIPGGLSHRRCCARFRRCHPDR